MIVHSRGVENMARAITCKIRPGQYLSDDHSVATEFYIYPGEKTILRIISLKDRSSVALVFDRYGNHIIEIPKLPDTDFLPDLKKLNNSSVNVNNSSVGLSKPTPIPTLPPADPNIATRIPSAAEREQLKRDGKG